MDSARTSDAGRSSGRFGAYVLTRRIAVGGMAEVYEARRDGEAVDCCPFVVKVLLPQHARDRELIRTLEHEAQLNKALDHENLVRVVDYGFEGEHPFLVMEKVDGVSLADLQEWLRDKHQRLSAAVAVHIVTELLRALVYVHEAKGAGGESLGIVHRDVTPQNVLLSCDGRVRLGDFGIARSNIRDTKTRTGVIKGKLRYLAPEQVTASAIDARTDVYAAGLILYELLTGQPFIRGDNEIQLLRAAEAPELRLPSSEGASSVFDAVVRAAVGRFPEERFPSARRFLEGLQTVAVPKGSESESESARNVLARTVNDAHASVADRDGDPVATAPTLATPLGNRPSTSRVNGGSSSSVPRLAATSAASRSTTGAPWVAAGALVAIVLAVWLGTSRPWDERSSRGQLQTRVGAVPNTKQIDMRTTPAVTSSSGPVATAPVEVAPVRPVAPGNGTKVVSVRNLVRDPVAIVRPVVPDPSTVAVDETALQGARDRLTAVRAGLRARGVLVEDLDESARVALRSAEQQIEQRRPQEAADAIAAAESATQAVQVDGAFVGRKLERVNARIAAAGRRGADTAELQNLQTAALQDFMEQRYDATNRRLNAILRLIGDAVGP